MNSLDEDLDDSALFYKSLIQKRKAFENNNPKSSKQLKLTFSQSSSKTKQYNEVCQNSTGRNSSKEKVKTDKDQNRDLKINESTSSYFHSKKSSNTCPLCLKVFKGDSVYSVHMKQCAKTHKMTTQQLLEALELQKKQMQERRDLGLCSQNVPSLKKTISKPKIQNDGESYDLALGIALSKSLASSNLQTVGEMQKATLEEFGFTSNSTVQRPWKKKNGSNKKSVLRDRTVEERQRIIVEKVAVVLLDEEERGDLNKKLNQNLTCQKTQELKLWNLGENHEKSVWYVDKIKTLLLTDQQNIEENTESVPPDNIKNEISELNLPQKDLYHSWKKMINNRFKSDLVVKTNDFQDVYLHSLVLCTRCPEALEKDYKSAFQKFNFSTILVFLEYLYCGTLNGLIKSEINDLFNLASELSFNELITTLNCLKDLLLKSSNSTLKLNQSENKESIPNITKNEKLETSEKDLFTDDINLTQPHRESVKDEINASENESNADKSYWSFIQHEKQREKLEEISKSAEKESSVFNIDTEKMEIVEHRLVTTPISRESEEHRLVTTPISRESEEHRVVTTPISRESEEKDLKSVKEKLSRVLSDDSTTKDLDFQNGDDKMSVDCIILSSDSESKAGNSFVKSQQDRSKTPSPVDVNYEIPYFDPYDNFHCFSEEQFSPVGLHSQSLLTGDISTESLKLSNPAQIDARQLADAMPEEQMRPVGYCSTPVTVRHTAKVKSSAKNSVEKNKKKRRDPSGSRILRKSLGLQSRKSYSGKKANVKRKSCKKFAEMLANSILEELSKSSVFQSPVSVNKFVEITPVSSKGEFGDSVTPSPNYSNMGDTMLKEQLTKYGLKKTLAKSKAKKILRHIYEELHPLYNTETGKIIKMLPGNTPKTGKKSKPKNSKAKRSKSKSSCSANKTNKEKNQNNSSKDSQEMFSESPERLPDHDSDVSEFDDLNETLTQSMPSNPVDLPSAFFEYLRNNPEYHQKILLYEPIWLEELQKGLKETFKKHFKMSDIMDFLDQKCITFRSEAQAKKLQERNRKKGSSKKNKGFSR